MDEENDADEDENENEDKTGSEFKNEKGEKNGEY